MLPAIEFDDQAMFDRREVGDEAADRMLAAKLGTGELTIAEELPHRPLLVGGCLSVFAGASIGHLAMRAGVSNFVLCRPSASKFDGSSQRSKAAFTAGHSRSVIEYQAVSRLRPL